MGKKVKAKSRLDPYYHFAKSQGYRSRAAYKLIQLNRKYNFLSSSNILIDLCAAPGGWMQVAAEFMPLGSTIVGVDLDPIKKVNGAKSFIGDITTKACYERLKKETNNQKCDAVLNDGAPNVGAQWNKDAYNQSQLTLSALKLACSFLREGGYFVTKVFRSTDFNSLVWVFNKFFQKVEVTKPKASRFVSAEIFVVCIGYLAPSYIDQKLFDAQYIFKDTEADHYRDQMMGEITSIDKLLQTRRKRGGYQDDAPMHLYKQTPLTSFIYSENSLLTFAEYNRITVTPEQRVKFIEIPCKKPEDLEESFKDLKVLGKRQIGGMIKWRGKVKQFLLKTQNATKKQELQSAENNVNIQFQRAENSEDELEAQMIDTQKKQLRTKRTKQEKRKEIMIRAQAANQQLNQDDQDFQYQNFQQVLDEVSDVENIAYQTFIEPEKTEQKLPKYKLASRQNMEDNLQQIYEEKKRVRQQRQKIEKQRRQQKKQRKQQRIHIKEGKLAPRRFAQQQARQEIHNQKAQNISQSESNDQENEHKQFSKVNFRNPLADLDDQDIYLSQSQEQVADQDIDPDEKMQGQLSDDEAYIIPKPISAMQKRKKLIHRNQKKKERKAHRMNKGEQKDDGKIEIVPEKRMQDYDIDSLAQTLAIAKKMLRNRPREQIIQNSYRGFTFEDHEQLPKWFTDDQKRHNFKQVPITKEQFKQQKDRLQAINARMPKKIMEAKVRKKIRIQKKLKKVQKKAEGIMNQEGVNEMSKLKTVTRLYDKSKQSLKDNKKYIVGKKGKASGGKGGRNIKHVDARMKKDKRAQKRKGIKKTRQVKRAHKRKGKF